VNRYIEAFLEANCFPEMFGEHAEIVKVQREVPIGNSKIDFLVTVREGEEIKTIAVEVKTGTAGLTTHGHQRVETQSPMISFERLMRHFQDLTVNVKEARLDGAKVIMCNMFDAPPFVGGSTNKKVLPLIKIVHDAIDMGIEFWQVRKIFRFFIIF
jgi:sugar fermentation stimulation protein A